MKRVPQGRETIRGIDIYGNDKDINWRKLAESDIDFVFVKATEGSTFKSKEFKNQWDNANVAGLIRGAYHFFRPQSDPIMQVDNFVHAVQYYYIKQDLPPVLDWEIADDHGPRDVSHALRWLELVEKALKRRPIIYTSPAFFNDFQVEKKPFAKYPLWIANYGVKAPMIPDPWQNWQFWQYTESGVVSGIPNEVDINLFNGSLHDLQQFILSSAVK